MINWMMTDSWISTSMSESVMRYSTLRAPTLSKEAPGTYSGKVLLSYDG